MIVIAGRPQQAVHAGGDDRQPPCGAFLFSFFHYSCFFGSVRQIKLTVRQLLGSRKNNVLYSIVS